jgi:predicted transposase/invertase (TIGR01784 family)
LHRSQKTLEELETLSDKWIYFLRYANEMKSVPASMGQEAAIDHAFTVAQQSKLTRREMEILEKRQMALHDNRNAILYAEQKGRREGEETGLEAGEQKAKREIARQLLDVLDVETISAKTGLGIAEIEALRLPVPRG